MLIGIILLRDFSHPDIFWESSAASSKQSGIIWGCIEDNWLKPPDLFLQDCSPASLPPVCMFNQDHSFPGAKIVNFSSLTSYDCTLPSSLSYSDLPIRPLCLPHHHSCLPMYIYSPFPVQPNHSSTSLAWLPTLWNCLLLQSLQMSLKNWSEFIDHNTFKSRFTGDFTK